MTSTLLLYGLLAAGLAASLFLFLSLKQEMLAQTRREGSRIDAKVNAAIARLESEGFGSEAGPEQTLVPAAPHSGLNLNKRVHALRLLRRGEDLAHIAAALCVPRREVELMIRVHQAARTRVPLTPNP